MIDFNTFTKMPKNVRDLVKLIVAKGFKKMPKVKKIAQSGHTGRDEQLIRSFAPRYFTLDRAMHIIDAYLSESLR